MRDDNQNAKSSDAQDEAHDDKSSPARDDNQEDNVAEGPVVRHRKTLHVDVLMDLLRTAFFVRRRFDAVMREQGITGQQYNVLRILRGAGEPLPTMEVSARMIEPEPGITRLIRRLETKGLVRRTQGSDDARRRLCTVTEEGLHVLASLDYPVEATNRRLTRDLSLEEREMAIDLLNRIRDAAIQVSE